MREINMENEQQQVSNFDRSKNWLIACGKLPSFDNLSVQIGCHLEELTEFIECIGLSSIVSENKMVSAIMTLEKIAEQIKLGVIQAWIHTEEREAALDALCDMEVTGNGVAYLAGFDKPTADARVLDSNAAKLVDGKPVILEGGKIGKPEGWTAPDLSDCV